MQPTKKCAFCGATARYQKIDHEEMVGAVKVVVPVMAYGCETCGEDDLTLNQLASLQQQAVQTALLDLPRIDGPTFRCARKAIGVTQAALARFMDVSPETVSRWESGATPVSRSAQLMLLSAVMLVREGRSLAPPDEPEGPLVSELFRRSA